MKVLQVNCVYKKGSTGKIVADIHTELQKRGIESVVCYGRGKKCGEKNVYKICGELYSKYNHFFSKLTGLMYGGLFFSTNKLISIIKKEKPDVVHLHCLNGYFVNIYRLVSWLKKSKIKTVLTLHAEFMHTGNCGYALDCEKWKTGCGKCSRVKQETGTLFFDRTHHSWLKMKKAFDGFDSLNVVSVSPWLMERAKQSPILADKVHCVVFNGVNTDIFKIYGVEDLKRKHGLKDEKIIFHATPYFSVSPSHLKGGYYVLKIAELLREENVKILVAGDYDKNLCVSDNILLLGKIEKQSDLAAYYSMADVTLLTSKKETFSMVCAESLCCGTPVVGFKAGAPEQISITEYSSFVEFGNVDLLLKTIVGVLHKKYDKNAQTICARAKENYSLNTMVAAYLKIYM